MSSIEIIRAELQAAAKVLDDFLSKEENLLAIEAGAQMLAESFQSGGKAMSCGNGGSACDAAHFSEELTGRFREDRDPLPAIAITEPGHITCVSNDLGYELVFSRFVKALGNKGDVLLAISTSGNSKNVVRAAEAARQKGMKVLALTGNGGGKLAELADVEVRVPHQGYADRIQEIHIKVIHLLIQLVENALTAE